MARGRRLRATFGDGSVAYLTTEKGFTHAWRVIGRKVITGWARSEALAQQAATHHARSAAMHWRTKAKPEVVEVEPT
jgi:hypothetical protein